ncbi:MAG: response regulator, partial [Actinomycetota bacterium]
PGSYVMLAVSDTGCGMSEAVQDHLFEPFFTTKETGKGTGLGLSTVYGIVAQSNAHITVYSEVGRGTTFKIYLPRLFGQAENGESAAAQTELPRGSGTVLLVEDETSVRELARRVLTLNGFTVIATGDPLEALALCERHQEPIRLLVTDMVMPKLNGLEMAQKVRAARPGIPVLYMSGYTEHTVLQQGLEELKGAFLQKPFVPRGLLEKVHEILETPI